MRAQQGTSVNPYQYTGQQFDALTGLYNLRARSYDPAIGRFLSRDTYPVDVQNPVELNRYGYTANNPINASDSTGGFAIETAQLNRANTEQAIAGAPSSERRQQLFCWQQCSASALHRSCIRQPNIDHDVAVDEDLIDDVRDYLGIGSGGDPDSPPSHLSAPPR